MKLWLIYKRIKAYVCICTIEFNYIDKRGFKLKEKVINNLLVSKMWLRKDSELSQYNNGWVIVNESQISEQGISSFIKILDEMIDIGEVKNAEQCN